MNDYLVLNNIHVDFVNIILDNNLHLRPMFLFLLFQKLCSFLNYILNININENKF